MSPAVTIPAELAQRVREALAEAGRFTLAAELERAATGHATVRWVWAEARVHLVDGHTLVARGRGLPLAWLLLAGAAHRLAPLSVAAVFPSSAAALQALDRAADQARPISPALAACIGCLGVARGVFVLRRRLPARIDFSAPVLERVNN